MPISATMTTSSNASAMPGKERMGERLVRMGAISSDQLQIALHEQRQRYDMLGSILIKLGFLDDKTLATVLAARTGLQPIDLRHQKLDADLIRRLPRTVSERCQAIPLWIKDGNIDIAMADPYDLVAMDELRRYFPAPLSIHPAVASRADILAVIGDVYDRPASVDSALRDLETSPGAMPANRDQAAGDYAHPMVRLVESLLIDAAVAGASDVHMEPENSFVRVRYRLDGRLSPVRDLHRTHWNALSQRIKVMAGMNIADTRSIQDGRFQMNVNGNLIDCRVAVMPSIAGETIVIRLLDHNRATMSLDDLGYSPESAAAMRAIMAKPAGLCLVTGPTGSGKTTTLYAMLRQLRAPDVHIATLEDPIEYQMDMVRQTAINEAQGLDFAAGVRGLLRMDPDILFIGEIRDAETAQMALRAAMTGHQVYSTLHCVDALGALPRLVDLGLSPRVLAGHLTGLVAQRLVRRLCPDCKKMRRATMDEAKILRCKAALPQIAEATGCDHCRGTGYQGRTAISEVLRITPDMEEMIASDAPRSALLSLGRRDGFRTMQEDGIARVLSGDISFDEMARAVDLTRGL